MSNGDRTRNWVSILYPESAKEDWLNLLREQYVPAFISPLHNGDFNPDGTPKKEHYHIILMFDSVKTEKQAQEVFDSIGAIKCQKIKSIRGQARYLCHLDNPEKEQYSISNVISLCGADYRETIELRSDDRYLKKEVHAFIKHNHIRSFADLCDYCMENNEDWYIIVTEKYSYFFDKYIKSKFWADKENFK